MEALDHIKGNVEREQLVSYEFMENDFDRKIFHFSIAGSQDLLAKKAMNTTNTRLIYSKGTSHNEFQFEWVFP